MWAGFGKGYFNINGGRNGCSETPCGTLKFLVSDERLWGEGGECKVKVFLEVIPVSLAPVSTRFIIDFGCVQLQAKEDRDVVGLRSTLGWVRLAGNYGIVDGLRPKDIVGTGPVAHGG